MFGGGDPNSLSNLHKSYSLTIDWVKGANSTCTVGGVIDADVARCAEVKSALQEDGYKLVEKIICGSESACDAREIIKTKNSTEDFITNPFKLFDPDVMAKGAQLKRKLKKIKTTTTSYRLGDAGLRSIVKSIVNGVLAYEAPVDLDAEFQIAVEAFNSAVTDGLERFNKEAVDNKKLVELKTFADIDAVKIAYKVRFEAMAAVIFQACMGKDTVEKRIEALESATEAIKDTSKKAISDFSVPATTALNTNVKGYTKLLKGILPMVVVNKETVKTNTVEVKGKVKNRGFVSIHASHVPKLYMTQVNGNNGSSDQDKMAKAGPSFHFGYEHSFGNTLVAGTTLEYDLGILSGNYYNGAKYIHTVSALANFGGEWEVAKWFDVALIGGIGMGVMVSDRLYLDRFNAKIKSFLARAELKLRGTFGKVFYLELCGNGQITTNTTTVISESGDRYYAQPFLLKGGLGFIFPK